MFGFHPLIPSLHQQEGHSVINWPRAAILSSSPSSSSSTKLIFHSLLHWRHPPPSRSYPCGPTLRSGCWWWFQQDCCFSVSSPTGSPLLDGHGPVHKRKCTEDWQVGKKKIHWRQQEVQLQRLQHTTLCVISTPLLPVNEPIAGSNIINTDTQMTACGCFILLAVPLFFFNIHHTCQWIIQVMVNELNCKTLCSVSTVFEQKVRHSQMEKINNEQRKHSLSPPEAN